MIRHTKISLFMILAAGVCFGQSELRSLRTDGPSPSGASPNAFTQQFKNAQKTSAATGQLKGTIHPDATPENDRGRVEPSRQLGLLSLTLQRTSEQRAALEKLLTEQQDPKSPNYHAWLTPEAFGERFGASAEDSAKAAAWLQGRGFADVQVSRGRDFITFNGAASQAEGAFRTELHIYEVRGQKHYANSTEPAVPSELAAIASGIRGLNDFYPKAANHRQNQGKRATGSPVRPNFSYPGYSGYNFLAPDDLSVIYNIAPLYHSGIDGTGQRMVIAGESDIDLNDIRLFRATFNLPNNDPQKVLVPGARNPGIDPDAEGEADLDLEWSGAVARNAKIYYVFSPDAFESVFYAIDQALAPVISFSFGICELHVSSGDVQILLASAQKAAAEGITWVASSGDSGAAGCEYQNGPFSSAISRLNVSLPASIPFVTAVGGTEFNEPSVGYWASSLGPNGGSALGYIPEAAWNDENLLALNGWPGFSSGGGGASWFFSKPSWQVGRGVPNDGVRDVPDVSLTASGLHDPYALVTAGQLYPTGGTSASAPSFAGILTLLNHYLVATGAQSRPGLGNANPMLYSMAQNVPSAFHDITAGSNIVPCVKNSTQDCSSGAMGYAAGSGYDLATGLGSVNAYNLVTNWAGTGAGVPSTSPHLVISSFTATTLTRYEGSFSMTFIVTNTGNQDAGSFQIRAYITPDGTIGSAVDYLYCNVTGLAAGAKNTCGGTLGLNAVVKPGTYYLLGVADGGNSVPETDRSGGTALASSGPLKVTN